MISVMPFTNVTKQIGVRSVGILYRECMVRVVFYYEGLEEIKSSRLDLKVYFITLTVLMGWFLAKQSATIL